MKIGPVNSEIICLKGLSEQKCRGVHISPSQTPKLLDQSLPNLHNNVAISSQINSFKPEWRYCNSFQNTMATNKAE